MKYQVKDCGYDNGLFAAVTICAGEVIDQFNGYETAYSSLSDEQKRLVFYLGTFSYNVFSRERLADGYADWWWDPLWNFDCRCESPRCQGRIEGYQFIEAN